MPLILQYNDDRARAIEALEAHVLRQPYGTLLRYADLRAVTGLMRPDIYGVVRRANRDLLKANRLLVNVIKIGYKLANAEEHLNHADHRRLKGRRQFLWSQEELTGLDRERLSPEQREAYDRLLTKISTLAHFAHKNTQIGIESSQRALNYQQQTLAQLKVMGEQLERLRKPPR